MTPLKTVQVEHPDFPNGITINEVDFKGEVHKRHAPRTIVAPPPMPPADAGTDEDDGKAGKMKVGEMRELLKQRGIAIPEGAKKTELQALVNASN